MINEIYIWILNMPVLPCYVSNTSVLLPRSQCKHADEHFLNANCV